ncbi:type I restriction enzyme HsdR N-terminal domain-containing protein [Metabacillus niabensis]|uniref:type I restriction enzyme HsdR N-terminal domain-containing protein n=1 Tax=Metabacillus niabensis TaxID=324854 RepID=UPI0015833E85
MSNKLQFFINSERKETTKESNEQLESYNKILKAKYLGISNGIQKHLYEVTNGNVALGNSNVKYT